MPYPSQRWCKNTSKGAVVEALFIDEGFGSLDKEALTKAIAVLEQIGENRVVGVISHVDDMKEGIAQQLAIIKSHDGSSSIKIVDKGKRSQGVKNSRQNVLIILRDSFSSGLSLFLSTYFNLPNYQFF